MASDHITLLIVMAGIGFIWVGTAWAHAWQNAKTAKYAQNDEFDRNKD